MVLLIISFNANFPILIPLKSGRTYIFSTSALFAKGKDVIE